MSSAPPPAGPVEAQRPKTSFDKFLSTWENDLAPKYKKKADADLVIFVTAVIERGQELEKRKPGVEVPKDIRAIKALEEFAFRKPTAPHAVMPSQEALATNDTAVTLQQVLLHPLSLRLSVLDICVYVDTSTLIMLL